MRALPARRIALGALCAALLAGLTGPAAVAADTAPAHDRATSSAALLAQVRTVDADEHGLTPVVDLVKAALTADGRLSSGEARALGDAAKAALVKAADEDPVTTTTTVTTTDDMQLVLTGDDLTSEELAALREALDSVYDLLRPDTGTDTTTEESTDTTTEADDSTEADTTTDTNATETPSMIDELLTRVDDLVSALIGTETQASTLPAPAGRAQTPLLPGDTLPALTSMLLPSSSS